MADKSEDVSEDYKNRIQQIKDGYSGKGAFPKDLPPRSIRQGFAPVSAPSPRGLSSDAVKKLDDNPAGNPALSD